MVIDGARWSIGGVFSLSLVAKKVESELRGPSLSRREQGLELWT
jgi:hypothetical protein